ncbi:MAG: glycoside hydrolase, partial [Ruminococcus sp.]|nr:glycoside hydrolase [Ruminococcus sp.]
GTKIGITEYDFQGAYDVTGAVMEADALGIFAQNEVYCANLFTMDAQYQLAGIDLYTNYDGEGSGFGDTLVSCESDDVELSTAYAAINGDNSNVVRLIVTNKSFADKTTANIKLDGEYGYVHHYGITEMAAKVFDMTDSDPAITLNGDSITFEMEPRTVSLLVIAKDKDSLTAKSETASPTDEKQKNKNSRLPLVGGIAGAAVIAGAAFAVRSRKKAN